MVTKMLRDEVGTRVKSNTSLGTSQSILQNCLRRLDNIRIIQFYRKVVCSKLARSNVVIVVCQSAIYTSRVAVFPFRL